MKKAVISAVLALFSVCFIYAGQARNIELVDVPTASTLLSRELRLDFKFSPSGGILSRLYIGLFERFYIGGAFNVNNIIGSGDINPDFPPNFTAKIRVTDDEAAVPAISLGYEGQGYMGLPAKGVFLAVTKEVNAGIIMQLSAAVYTSNFAHFGQGVDFGAGMAFGITRELTACMEIDGVFGGDDWGRINFGIGYFFDPIEIDLGFKFGYGDMQFAQARILKIVYISYF
jgi:hypothetical protein